MPNQVPRLWGQTLGLISFGNVATAVARRAKAFGLHVIAFDPYVTELKMTAEGVEPVSLGELYERSDYLSVHPGLNDETRGMLNRDAFRQMKDSVVIINCGRGPVIDETALAAALEAGEVAAAGLDVMEKEPARAGQSPACHGQRHHYAARCIGNHQNATGDAASSRARGLAGLAGQVANELRQSDRAAENATRALAALPDGPRSESIETG
ncbi:MAG: NAD(P)-dependent oxidoreductase [Gammaproteobacteria bacterium]|nr:NAD(P)-dependent oxidoreductase [Gammaproteobacteria bacterium]